jgi:uncharacterized protein YjbI with pentapeptide repeats
MAAVAAAHKIHAPGQELDAAALERLAEGAWDVERGAFRFEEADFVGARFRGPISFAGAEFGRAQFTAATFQGPVSFEGADFIGQARFDAATFEESGSFRYARFRAAAIFEDEGAPDGRRASVIFNGWADFTDASFAGPARFGGAQFESRARFGGVSCESDLTFTGATFSRARTLGPVDVRGVLDLDRATFEASVRIGVHARRVSCVGTGFRGRAVMNVSGGELTLEDSEFLQPATVASRPMAHLLSLNGADVANLTIADVDLRDCSFLSTHNLDQLRLEESDFRPAEGWWKTSRRIIADEIQFRSEGRAEGRTANRVADIYRSLRKGREDNKDEPGSADFYYGEMEMRRRGSGGFERVILTAYWLASGYGLRASRAVAALAATVVLFAVGFAELSGFDPDQGFWKSVLFSAESTSALFRAPVPPEGAELNDEGHVLQMGLRLLGPLFIGLALLALRARVKR